MSFLSLCCSTLTYSMLSNFVLDVNMIETLNDGEAYSYTRTKIKKRQLPLLKYSFISFIIT